MMSGASEMSAERQPNLDPPTPAQHGGVDATIIGWATICRLRFRFHSRPRYRPLPNRGRLIVYLPGTTDFITLLTTTKKSQILTKQISLDQDGNPHLQDYDQAKHFRFDKVTVSGLSDLARVVDSVSSNSALVLGEPTDAAVTGARRLAYDRPESGERATLTATTHHWLPVDLDSVPCPDGLDPIANPEAAVQHVVRHYLLTEMQDRDVYWQLTSSVGIKPGIRLRLFFWLDRTLSCEEMKRWQGGFEYVDPSIYTANQLIYAARPIFAENVPDPVPRRSGILAGIHRTVSPPDPIPPITAGRESAKDTIDTGPRGYAAWCKRVGDHEDGEGFHEPIKKAIGAYIGVNCDVDTEHLRAHLEQVIRAAPRNTSLHPDSYVEKQIRDLPRLIKWTQEQEARPRERQFVEAPPSSPTDAAIQIAQRINIYNSQFAVIKAGNVRILSEYVDHRGRPTFDLLSLNDFRLWCANDFIGLPDGNGGIEKVEAPRLWLTSPNRREYSGVVFQPGKETPGFYNLWRGFAVTPRQDGSCELFKAHLRDNVCRGNEELFRWVFSWFAHIFQHPADKCGTALVLRGKQGVGKTIVGKTIGHLIGKHFLKVANPRYVIGRFNAHMESLLLLHCDEAFWAGDHAAEGLIKDLITGEDHLVERKGVEAIRVDNYVRVLICGNEDWLVPAGLDERRFAVLDVGTAHQQDAAYFRAMEEELVAGGYQRLMYELRTFDLSSVNLRITPKTEALLDQKIETLGDKQRWWFNILQTGRLPHGDLPPNRCLSELLVTSYVEYAQRTGARRRADETAIGMFIKGSKHKKGVAPGLGTNQETYRGRVVRVYTFPSLADCRAAFEREMHQEIPWDGPEEWVSMGGVIVPSLTEFHPAPLHDLAEESP
jgi:hypothetical protein